jgi:hypothetical protein
MRHRGVSYYTFADESQDDDDPLSHPISAAFVDEGPLRMQLEFPSGDRGTLRETDRQTTKHNCTYVWDSTGSEQQYCQLEKFEGPDGKLIFHGAWQRPATKQSGLWWIHLDPISG